MASDADVICYRDSSGLGVVHNWRSYNGGPWACERCGRQFAFPTAAAMTITPDPRDAELAAARSSLASVERERDALREEVMAPCDCPAHLAQRRAEAAESALSAAERERDARQELLVDIARDLDLLGRDLSSIPGSVRSALSAARADLGRETRERRAEFERLASALSAAREAAKREKERADAATTSVELRECEIARLRRERDELLADCRHNQQKHAAAREEAKDADRVRALLGGILDAVCGALKPNTPPGVLPSYADLPDLARAAREEARHFTDVANRATAERCDVEAEVRRLTEQRDAAVRAGAEMSEARERAESSARRLRESVAAYAKSCRAFVEPSPGSYLRGRYDASLAVADELDAIVARAALGSSPVEGDDSAAPTNSSNEEN